VSTGEQADVIREALRRPLKDRKLPLADARREHDAALAALASLEDRCETAERERDDVREAMEALDADLSLALAPDQVAAARLADALARVASLEAERDALVGALREIAEGGAMNVHGHRLPLDGAEAAEIARAALGARLAQAERQEKVSEPGRAESLGGDADSKSAPGSLTSSLAQAEQGTAGTA
jgi:chromosome segregation ATPase